MRFREATKADVFSVVRIHHKSTLQTKSDPLLSDLDALAQDIETPNSQWFLTEIEGATRGFISTSIDHQQRLAKITRMQIDPDVEESSLTLKHMLLYAIDWFAQMGPKIDVIFSTTVTMTMEQQMVTLDAGFNIYGVFPNLVGEDNSQLNGISAYYFGNTLETSRLDSFKIHPGVHSFFKIAQQQIGLKDIDIASLQEVEALNTTYGANLSSSLPVLELIQAEHFVAKRFKEHAVKHAQVLNFYPFYAPNCIITDPSQKCEVFLRLNREKTFCAIIGEHLMLPVNPIKLFERIFQILRDNHVSYIEIISDAADVFGIDCILKSGFTPCAYIPAFKLQGQTRRDYVVFGKSFEYLCRPNLDTHPAYIDFYREYFKIEGKNYFPDFKH